MLSRLILAFIMLAPVLSVVIFNVARADPGWYTSGWSYRKMITINSANVTADQTNFPVLINISSDSDLASDAQNDGDDILFTDSGGETQLSHEIEKFDGGTGELVAWVKIPSLSSSSNTIIYMYYGNSGAGNSENVTGVWDSNFMMVQHLPETSKTGGVYNDHLDSTSNDNDGEAENGVSMNSTGKMNGADYFDGSDDYVAIADSNSLDTSGNITIEAWIKHSNMNAVEHIISHHDSGAKTGYLLNQYTNNNFRAQLGDGITWVAVAAESTNAYSDPNAWYHVVFTSDGSTWRFYVNGAADGSGDSASIAASGNDVWIGDDVNVPGTRYWQGSIDEVRISDTARSADWIQTSYNNQSDPSSFYTLGSEESTVAAVPVGGQIRSIDKFRVLGPLIGQVLVLIIVIGGSAVLVGHALVSKGSGKEL